MSVRTTPWDGIETPDFYSDKFEIRRKYNNNKILSSPRNIYNFLDERVFGQEDYKKAISTFIYKALKGINSEKVILIASESASGKSYVVSLLSEIVENFVITDGASLVLQGFRGGNHITTVLNKLDVDSNIPGFVVIDEFNRTLEKGISDSWSGSSLLSELLVLFDDKDAKINASTNEDKPLWVSPSKLFFILLGSFSNITDQKTSTPIGFNSDIHNSGKSHRAQITKEHILETLAEWPELVGRISRIIVNPNMDEKSYYKMLSNPKYSPATKLEQELGIKIKISSKKMKEYAKKSYDSGTGVRGIKNAILEELDEALFNDPNLNELYIR